MKSRVICVIMGGGRGTRLYPLTKLRCKPAVPLAGKYRLVDIPISNCLSSGYNRIFILTQFQTASLHRHIQESYKFDPFGGGCVDILSAEQTEKGSNWYQGTADAVRQNLDHFHAREEDLYLILSGDQLYRMNFRAMVEQHRQLGSDITVAARAMPRDQVAGLGLMRVRDDHAIEEFVEKPKDPAVIDQLVLSDTLRTKLKSPGVGRYVLANMGIYIFNYHTLHEVLRDARATDFGKEIIPGLIGRAKVHGYIFDGYWEDIGTVRSFFEANLSLTDPDPPFNFFEPGQPIFTHARYLPASRINRCKIDRAILADGCAAAEALLDRVVVGVRSVIDEGSHLHHAVMMGADYFETPAQKQLNRERGVPDIGIGRNCRIRQAIIDKNARIGHNVHLSPEGKPDLWEQGDVMVRDGIVIVMKNGVVPDGTRIEPGHP